MVALGTESGVAKVSAERVPVTRERALTTAVALADSGGIDAVSMRKLASELGIEAMSLYYHVKNKDEILDGMIEIVIGEMALASPDDDWRTALRERADSARAVLARHPWAISLVDARTTVATLRHHDSLIECLRAAGFSIAMAAHAMSLVDSYVRGFAMQEATLPTNDAGDISAATESILDQEELMAPFPHLAEMGRTLVLQPGYAYGNEFEFGMRLILDGIATSVASESHS